MRTVKYAALTLALLAAVFAVVKLSSRSPGIEYVEGDAPSGIELIENPSSPAEKIVNGAKMEALRGVRYDARYARIPYPNGDVPEDRGACTDVVIRALRNAGFDLQQLVHEDMRSNFGVYPRNWGLSAPDPNIDHRRVPNHIVFLRRNGLKLPIGLRGAERSKWKPGDLVYWKLDNGLDHCGVISNDIGPRGLPLVIHNLGIATQEDCLDEWKITGHFRYPAPD